jgi:hypothetical protein
MLGSNPGLLRHLLVMRKQVFSQIVTESLMKKCAFYVHGIQIGIYRYTPRNARCVFFYRPMGTVYSPKVFFLFIAECSAIRRGINCKRPIQCLASSEILTTRPLTDRRVYPPRLWCGGRTHSLGGEGVGVRKTPDTALYSIYARTL